MESIDHPQTRQRNADGVHELPSDTQGAKLITTTQFGTQELPLVIMPLKEDTDLIAWAREKHDFIEATISKYGGILFRNFPVSDIVYFHQLVSTVSDSLLEYRERSSPRSKVSEGIYTSTDHPSSQRIFLHNENSYQQIWPLKIFFYCVTPAQTGGETSIADTRRIYARIHPDIRERFAHKQVMYVRNFGDGFGLSWQEVFQTTSKEEVETYCQRFAIQVEWKSNNRLRTRQIRPAVATHPRTGEILWFNHATFFHVSTLEPNLQAIFLAEFKEEELPNNTYYGDGSTIEAEVAEHLREAYLQETVKFPWQTRDILILDNMLIAHGREPFSGARKVLVAMSEPVSRAL